MDILRLLCIGVVLLVSGQYAVLDAQETPVVARHDLKVTIMPERHLLKGESLVTYGTASGRVFLNITSAAAIERVSLGEKELHYSFSGGALAVDLPQSAGKSPAAVRIDYHITYDSPPPERPGSSEDPTYGVTGTITKTGVFLGSDAGWYPAPQSPPRYRRIEIVAPAGMESITSGKRIMRETRQDRTRSVWEERRPVGVLALSAGPYLIQERQLGDVAIYTYFYPDNAHLAKTYLDAAVKYIGMYRELFGPYPFEKFAAVENFFPTGYGYPSYTLLGSTVIRLPFIVDTSFPHEIAHCWWGNGVLVDYREGNWSEGLVTYVADYMLEEKKSPAAARDYRLRILSDYASLVQPERDFPLSRFISRTDPASRAIGYGKGAMVFHMVRRKIGDKAFFGALRAVCRDRLYNTATWSDFTKAFANSSGQKMDAFMDQWLTRTGGPTISFEKAARRRKGAGWSLTGAVIQQAPKAYSLSLPLRIDTERGAVEKVLPVTVDRTPFQYGVRYRPKRIVLDPEADVFRRLSPGELPPTVNLLKGSRKLAVVKTADCRADDSTLRELTASLDQEQAPIVGEEKPGIDLAAYDLLFCGLPRNKSLSLSFPAGMTVGAKEFTVDGSHFAEAGDLLFVVTQHPLSVGKRAGLFLPLSPDAASLYVPKITHYGKYGYLVFSGGGNKRKGSYTPAVNEVEFSGD